MTTSSPSFFSLARRSFWLLFGGIWLLAGVFILVFGVVFALREQEFSTNGVVTTGIVLTKTFVPADSDSSTEYRVSYRFSAEDGKVVEGSDDVSVETWDGLTERGPIEIGYLRGRPESNRLGSGSDLFVAVIFLVGGVVFGGIGGFLVFRALSGIRKAQRLLQVGVPAVATVTEVASTNVTYNRRPQFRVRFSYVDGKGGTHAGESGYMEFEEANSWNPGDAAHIRYDPDRPEESQWIGAADPALAANEKSAPIDAAPPIDAPPVDAPPPA
jgi:hypothetical protein